MTKRVLASAAAALALFSVPQVAGASGDWGCYAGWTLESPSYTCAGRAMIAPGNDTRINMAFLLRDSAGLYAPGALAYPKKDWETFNYGRVFLSWDTLQATFWPRPETEVEEEDTVFTGSRCASFGPGTDAFVAALGKAKGLNGSERETLETARRAMRIQCMEGSSPDWPEGITSRAGQDFLAYLKGADAFYGDDFGAARKAFTALQSSADPWLAETSAYMVARNELAAAQAGAFDEWGSYEGGDKIDKAAARAGYDALGAYLAKWPGGLYASSAEGLKRRALWLMGDAAGLGGAYATLLDRTAPASPEVPLMLQEIDNKLLFSPWMNGAGDQPLLLAALDLMRMRADGPYLAETMHKPLSAVELAAQAPMFAGREDLYSFVQANHAYYVTKDYRQVLQLLPDDARQSAYTPLAFSRQMLRGMALEALGDRNAAGFWRELMGGAQDLYQRPTVELAWAINRERAGAVDEVFAPGSPVREAEIRIVLLQETAGPELLRRQVTAGLDKTEREVALYTLLIKQLSRGHYAQFGKDLALVPQDAPKEGWWSGNWLLSDPESTVPLGAFTQGTWSDGYPCPALASTAAALAANPRDAGALVCLGEFYRLNGLDDYLAGETAPKPARTLGSGPDQYPGKTQPRAGIYSAVIADPAALGEAKAYALYRAVWCYGPSGNNSCGGAEVPKAVRKGWFQRLKREYPKSKWASELKYYW